MRSRKAEGRPGAESRVQGSKFERPGGCHNAALGRLKWGPRAAPRLGLDTDWGVPSPKHDLTSEFNLNQNHSSLNVVLT